MRETTSESTSGQQPGNGTELDRATLDRLRRSLDDWRGRIDELMVRVDLADLGVREELRKRVDVTQNAYLAAKNRLSDIPKDVGANVGTAVKGLEKLLADLRQAYEAAEAVVRRSRPDQ
jgi:hypothetical protein